MTESLIAPPGTPGAADQIAPERAAENGASSLLYPAPSREPEPSREAEQAADAAPGSPEGEEETNALPPEYEPFTLPQGIEIDTATLEEAQSLFAEARLSQPQAQKLVDLYAGRMGELIQRQIEAQVSAAQDRQKAWIAEVRNDPELGGPWFEPARAAAQRALGRFGTPELRRALDELGVSNSPQLFRFFVRVGQALSEDGHAKVRLDAPGPTAAETLYPHQNTSPNTSPRNNKE